MQKPLAALALAAASVIVLSGCSVTGTTQGADDDTVRVVASTNIYGSLAAQIGGERVDVTSLIDSVSKDPHSYEATARDRLAVQKADLVIENGAGYDSFMTELLDGSDAAVITAARLSHDYPPPPDEAHVHLNADEKAKHDEEATDHDAGDHDADDHDADDHDEGHSHQGHNHIKGFNEHVWFDVHTMTHVVEAIAEELTEIDPAGKADFASAADELITELSGMEDELDGLHEKHEGQQVFITEPLPGLLAAAMGLDDATPDGFASAVEEGNDVPPAVLLDALAVLDDGEVRAVLTNAQTGGSETQRVEKAAADAGIPVVTFSELLAPDQSYAEWMRAAISDLVTALDR
ncbi:Zinc ABC transporter, periplasmic-binding protein ZnuA [Microbacterium esteraromaticum]|uniref:Zinc ABC transporter, periplasmic-binding protein ZnuA n=1 Tax=Microbacterium esteraromaticum TaxID=57043 RepID=A0A1R4IBP0_9MICO|nr:zinc ABC transporter substrate-binding protein [Microbacterium esteraromaticum]SJN17311.1 Zinc ABC transporter, periplasmic-binding protein ZnuA [Microbacterium esteraromaticum]